MEPESTQVDPAIDVTIDAEGADAEVAAAPLDLDGIERDLAGVEAALARLDAGSYWTDEVTGAPLPAELLAVHPTARRLAAG